jgi:autotransporter-associated beta strand protein
MKKAKVRGLEKYILMVALLGSGIGQTQTKAENLYWDANGDTAGAGSAPSGTWGTDNFWNTDATGGAGTFGAATSAADDLFLVAAPGAASGNSAYTITVNGVQAAGSLTFQSSGSVLVTGGTIGLGAGGLLQKAIAYSTTAGGGIGIASAIELRADSFFSSDRNFYDNNVPSINVTGVISDGGNNYGLTISSTGRVILSGSNTFSGGVTVAEGAILQINNASALGSGTLTFKEGATLRAYNLSVTTNNAQVWDGDFKVQATSGNSYLNLGTGTVTLTGDRAITVSMGGLQSFSVGAITDGGNGYGLTKKGNDSLTINGASTYGGDTIVEAGHLYIGVNNGLPVGTVLSISSSAVFNLRGWNQSIAGLQGSGTVWNENSNKNAASTLTVDSTGTTSFDGVIKDGSIASRILSLTKSGDGTQTLAGANTYTGATTVNAGTLLVNGDSSAATGAVTVNTGATLGGQGTIGGNTTVNAGATLSPGGSIGKLSFTGDLTLNGDLFIEVNSTSSYDQLDIGGSFTLGSGATLTLGGLDGAAISVGEYELALFNKAFTGNFSSITVNGLDAADYSYTWSDNSMTLNLTIVPEPSALALLGIGAALLALTLRGAAGQMMNEKLT